MIITPIPVFYMFSAKKDSPPCEPPRPSRFDTHHWPVSTTLPHIVLARVDLLESRLTDVIVLVCCIYCLYYLQGLGTMNVRV